MTRFFLDDELIQGVLDINGLVDLPNGGISEVPEGATNVPGGEVCESHWSAENSLCLLMTTGLYFYQRGRQVAVWLCEIDEYDHYTTAHHAWSDNYEHQLAYLYTGDRLVSLEDNGQMTTIVDGAVTPYDYEIEDKAVGAYYIEDGALKLYCDVRGDISRRTVVPSGVVSATGFGTPFIGLSDGVTYYIAGWNDDDTAQLAPLGTKTPMEYRVSWREQANAYHLNFEDFAEDCREAWRAEKAS